ncbi:MAG: hypothetical protein AAFU80_25730 [Pseudomonadota bacterium]
MPRQFATNPVAFLTAMDPEIEQYERGDCPILGMALEPAVPMADAGPNPELVDFKRGRTIALGNAAMTDGSGVDATFLRDAIVDL